MAGIGTTTSSGIDVSSLLYQAQQAKVSEAGSLINGSLQPAFSSVPNISGVNSSFNSSSLPSTDQMLISMANTIINGSLQPAFSQVPLTTSSADNGLGGSINIMA